MIHLSALRSARTRDRLQISIIQVRVTCREGKCGRGKCDGVTAAGTLTTCCWWCTTITVAGTSSPDTTARCFHDQTRWPENANGTRLYSRPKIQLAPTALGFFVLVSYIYYYSVTCRAQYCNGNAGKRDKSHLKLR